jgi:hypothetical protein
MRRSLDRARGEYLRQRVKRNTKGQIQVRNKLDSTQAGHIAHKAVLLSTVGPCLRDAQGVRPRMSEDMRTRAINMWR